jgi:hypothetical protein
LEVGLVKLMEMRRLEPLSQLVERLGALEESVRTGAGSASTTAPRNASLGSAKAAAAGSAGILPANASEPRETAAGRMSSPPASTAREETTADRMSSLPASEVREETTADRMSALPANENASEIDQIKSSLEKRRKMFLVTALDGASRASIEGDELCIEFAPESRYLRDTLAKADNVKILREVCREITARDLGVRFVIKDQETDNLPVSKEDDARREKQTLRERAEKDPVVQQMLRTFRGEVVDVRRVDNEQ